MTLWWKESWALGLRFRTIEGIMMNKHLICERVLFLRKCVDRKWARGRTPRPVGSSWSATLLNSSRWTTLLYSSRWTTLLYSSRSTTLPPCIGL
jgi:hypothetical protein